jgi:hypothetical protein
LKFRCASNEAASIWLIDCDSFPVVGGRISSPHLGDKAVAAARGSFYETGVSVVVTECFSDGRHCRGNGGQANCPSIPDLSDQLVMGNNAVAVSDEVVEDVKRQGGQGLYLA